VLAYWLINNTNISVSGANILTLITQWLQTNCLAQRLPTVYQTETYGERVTSVSIRTEEKYNFYGIIVGYVSYVNCLSLKKYFLKWEKRCPKRIRNKIIKLRVSSTNNSLYRYQCITYRDFLRAKLAIAVARAKREYKMWFVIWWV